MIPDLSIVMPCLNEAQAVGACVARALTTLRSMNVRGEVIVADNGSTDGSIMAARAAGAIVVEEAQRGYGRACLAGLRAAHGEILILGDADLSYDFGEIPSLSAVLNDGYDLVLGSRFMGEILPSAMPFSRRFIGNPLLTVLFNTLFVMRLTDSHSGLRAMRRHTFNRLNLRADGMEFAVEMLIAARRAKLRITEVPIRYYPRYGESKLRPIPDAWRHVALMLRYRLGL